MNFAFKGRNGRGELVEGVVDAASSDAVAAQLGQPLHLDLDRPVLGE